MPIKIDPQIEKLLLRELQKNEPDLIILAAILKEIPKIPPYYQGAVPQFYAEALIKAMRYNRQTDAI